MIIYENTVKSKGSLVGEFGDGMFILFGDNAPDMLKDYCYGVDVVPTNATIEAIEIDEAAYNECCENLQNSPWAERLKAYHTSFQEFLSVGKLYDLIISNPPFYTANYKAPAAARHIARSAEALPFDILLGGVSRLLASTGYFSVIIPYAEEESFIHLAAQYALYPVQGLRTQGTPDAPLKRSLLLFSNTRTITPFVPQTLTIEMTRHNYTLAYKTLTKEFYLNF